MSYVPEPPHRIVRRVEVDDQGQALWVNEIVPPGYQGDRQQVKLHPLTPWAHIAFQPGMKVYQVGQHYAMPVDCRDDARGRALVGWWASLLLRILPFLLLWTDPNARWETREFLLCFPFLLLWTALLVIHLCRGPRYPERIRSQPLR